MNRLKTPFGFILWGLVTLIPHFSFGSLPVNESKAVRFIDKNRVDISRTVEGGILFPSYFSSAGVNPGALPEDRGRGVELKTSPGLLGNPLRSQLTFATSSSGIGFGAGLLYERESGVNSIGLHAGLGVRMGDFTSGLTYKQRDLLTASGQIYTLNFSYAPRNGLNAGFKIHTIDDSFSRNSVLNTDFQNPINNFGEAQSNQMELAVGYNKRRSYNIEFNWLLGTDNPLKKTVLSVAGGYYLSERMGLGVVSKFIPEQTTFETSVSASYWLKSETLLHAKYTTPDVVTLGLTVLF